MSSRNLEVPSSGIGNPTAGVTPSFETSDSFSSSSLRCPRTPESNPNSNQSALSPNSHSNKFGIGNPVGPDGRSGGVKKMCDECGGSSPVACRICTACGADFFSNAGDKGGDSPSDPEADYGISAGERRRSERVKRDKPDYYDALDFEHKRKSVRGKRERGTSVLGRPRTVNRPDSDQHHQSQAHPISPRPFSGTHRGRGRGSTHSSFPPPSASSARAHLTWKKGSDDYDDDRDKRRRKRPLHHRDQDQNEDFMDYLSSEKGLQCRVGLAEINRKLNLVRTQPL